MKKKVAPNVIVGYDNGEVTMYYWQKEPIGLNKTNTFGFKIAWWKRDWLMEIKWWLTGNKGLTIDKLEYFIKKIKKL